MDPMLPFPRCEGVRRRQAELKGRSWTRASASWSHKDDLEIRIVGNDARSFAPRAVATAALP
jgi:hypothetical protein